MANKTVNATIQIRKDTAQNWETNNPILALGECGFDTTNNHLKIGDGVKHWNDLDFMLTRDQTIDLILDNYLAREIIAEWMETQKEVIVNDALEPIMDGTYTSEN